ncbi:MAG: CDP-alcohol phosphatidyltransferase family protein [Vampirovibrio sp.]|nr:CDP-alcohol phosphatidyltransferase family protein [Vampirovibrio sp.]
MLANWISVIRTLLAIGVVGLLFIVSPSIYWACFILTILIIWMDGLDGYVARKLNQSSKFGAVLDILSDRIVEQVYWIGFLALEWIPLWIPIVVVARGVLVDGLRGLALEQGFTAFGQTTMMQSNIGVLLVSSRFSRWSYAFFKAVAFSVMILAHTPGLPEAIGGPALSIGLASVYISVGFCILRGLPVILESRRFWNTESSL